MKTWYRRLYVNGDAKVFSKLVDEIIDNNNNEFTQKMGILIMVPYEFTDQKFVEDLLASVKFFKLDFRLCSQKTNADLYHDYGMIDKLEI